MRFLILGSGYIGKELLKKAPFPCIGTTTHPENIQTTSPLREPSLLIEGKNITSSLLDSFAGAIVLVAPNTHTLSAYEETYVATATAFTKALTNRTSPFYLLQISSTGAYIDSDKGLLLRKTEALYHSCHNPYVTVCTLRLGGIYGPERDLVSRAKKISGKTIPGSGKSPTNHIHRDDAVQAIIFAIEKKLAGFFDLVNDDHRTKEELYGSICAKLSIPPPLFSEDMQASHSCGIPLSNDPIKKTGFIFSHPICNLDGD